MINIRYVNSIDCEELKCYQGISEAALRHFYEPQPGLFIAESPLIIERALDAGYVPESFLVESMYLDGEHAAVDIKKVLERAEDVPVYAASLEELKKITGYTITRGILCAMKRKNTVAAEKLLESARRIAVLEDVMNPANLGAIMRSAAALGMDAVLLTSGCTDPLYRRAARVSMGTVFQLPWTYIDSWCDKEGADEHEGIRLLHSYGFKTAAMALKKESVGMRELCPEPDEKIAFILGSEGPGLCDKTIDACDITVKIPMYNGVDSLNVAAASAIAFWQIGR